MPVDLAVLHAAATATPSRPLPQGVVIVRRSPRECLRDAELRGAPDHELRLLEEAAIAAGVTRIRALLRSGAPVTAAERAAYERDCELLRRFPEDRRGVAGEGWFHLAR